MCSGVRVGVYLGGGADAVVSGVDSAEPELAPVTTEDAYWTKVLHLLLEGRRCESTRSRLKTSER